MSIFNEVKEAVSMREIASFYGLTVNRSGMCCCPFHQDKHPSMKLYEHNYKCFGCGVWGDVINFVENMDGISPLEAAKKIAGMFGINYSKSFDWKALEQQKKHWYEELIKRKAMEISDREFAVWRRDSLYTIREYLDLLQEWQIEYAPKTELEEWHSLFCEAYINIDQVKNLMDELDFLSDQEIKKNKEDYDKEVRRIAERISQFRNNNSIKEQSLRAS